MDMDTAHVSSLYVYTFDFIQTLLGFCRRRDASGPDGGVAVLHPAEIPQPSADLINEHRASASVVVQWRQVDAVLGQYQFNPVAGTHRD